MPIFDTVHECFKYHGTHYNFKTLKALALQLIESEASYNNDIGEFLLQWQDKANTIALKTSGSTGIPKTIIIEKQAMVNSALATGAHFNLQPSNSALLCLPAHYIAGKMMLVRALVLGLELDSIEPKSNLEIAEEKHYHFTAMVPLQLEKNRGKLKSIKTIIVGGAQVSSALKIKLQDLKTTIFETYGMTETVSHIAVKQLNNFTSLRVGATWQSVVNYFKVLPNINISQDNRDCLIINAPQFSKNEIITNDVVQMHSKNEFEWLGRFDNIINSGGLKINPEQVEEQLKKTIKERFFIASEKNETLGQQLILIVEAEFVTLKPSDFMTLNKFEKPKNIYVISKFIETSSGKINRKDTLKLLK
ncbi:AMP-binding protein [Lacinutrix jangbogonensis]|uniref:AMP-binding protein n=1 Tax=Lacinutrix jangbogonensis TaxID=1469557 RepID=UPI00053F25A8|nr:AMP-binding protein [Lacinutrix jangbogonensis]